MNKLINENINSEQREQIIQHSEYEISLINVIQIILENLKILIIGPFVIGVASLLISLLIPPTFTAKTQFLPPQQQQSVGASMLASLGSLGGLAGAVGAIKNPSDQYIAYMNSVTFQDALIERFNLKERYKTKTKTDTRVALTKNVKITAGKDGLMAVEVDDTDPHFAAELANAHTEELAKLLGKLATTEAQQRRMFFEKQLIIAKDKLVDSELLLKATGVAGSVLKTSPTSAVASVAGLQAAITAQEIKIGAMRGYLAETAPDLKLALGELANLKLQLTKLEQDSPIRLIEKNKDGDYITKYRNFKYHETLFELFTKQYELAKVDESREGSIIQILDLAEAPERKTKPKNILIALMSTLASFIIVLIYILIKKLIIKLECDIETIEKIEKLKKTWKAI